MNASVLKTLLYKSFSCVLLRDIFRLTPSKYDETDSWSSWTSALNNSPCNDNSPGFSAFRTCKHLGFSNTTIQFLYSLWHSEFQNTTFSWCRLWVLFTKVLTHKIYFWLPWVILYYLDTISFISLWMSSCSKCTYYNALHCEISCLSDSAAFRISLSKALVTSTKKLKRKVLDDDLKGL